MSDPIDHADQFRDDTAPAFPLPRIVGEIVGKFVPAEQREPYPLYQFDMPPARAAFPVFVPANLVTTLIEAHKRGDRDAFAVALDKLADAVDPPNNNSGARAPIQGQG